MKNAKISNAVIKRLPRYRRYLIELKKKGVEKISSKEFSNLIGYTVRTAGLRLQRKGTLRRNQCDFGPGQRVPYGYHGCG